MESGWVCGVGVWGVGAGPGGGGTQVLNDYPLPNGRAERRR